jgi:hypothetical protein
MNELIRIVAVVGVLSLVFLATQPMAGRRHENLVHRRGAARRDDEPAPGRSLSVRLVNRADETQRTRTDRRDLRKGIGRDFAVPEVQETLWPPDPRALS